ncbi:hypothetical protein HDV05_004646 [Chytridiales sp. JEL 0842]|nr:hypothetical protein HDV05_004646 [Chytridiales sp. JEL 0842]
MPPSAKLYAKVGSAISFSSTVSKKVSTHSSISKSLERGVTGGDTLLTQFTTNFQEGGDVLIAPQTSSSASAIGTIQLNGVSEYNIQKKAYLASTNGIHFHNSAEMPFGLFRLTGSGVVVVSGSGGLLRVVLGVGEEYLVSFENLVGWDASIHLTPEFQRQVATAVKSRGGWSKMAGKLREQEFKEVGLMVWEGVKRVGTGAWLRFREYMLGDKPLYRLRGPGEVFIASRVERGFVSGLLRG